MARVKMTDADYNASADTVKPEFARLSWTNTFISSHSQAFGRPFKKRSSGIVRFSPGEFLLDKALASLRVNLDVLRGQVELAHPAQDVVVFL